MDNTETETTNATIGALMQQQTYAERMEMASWFASILNDLKVDLTAAEGFDPADIASLFEQWSTDGAL